MAIEPAPMVVEVIGRFTAASNATLLAVDENGTRVVYKPTAGERPLWDFPPETLATREALTFEVSEAMGLGVVPPTRLGDGPFGRGSIQTYIEHDAAFDSIELVRRDDPLLWPIAVLDIVTNNADRKLGHVLFDGTALIAIDHGLTFHPDEKLRTVLWGFAGKQLPVAMVEAVEQLHMALEEQLGRRLESLLGPAERRALRHRTQQLLARPVHPQPPTDRPPIPWPPY